VHTRWIETEFRNDVTPWQPEDTDAAEETPVPRQTVTVEVDGKRLEVTLPAIPALAAVQSSVPGTRSRRPRRSGQPSGSAAADTLTAPMQGTVIKVEVTEGQQVTAGDLVLVLEAMKMEQPVSAHKSGTITNLAAQAGATITSGTTICDIITTDESSA
jgi:acetyl-CoA/propionyl-CoA carboxylase biotin carboxyl carrier protein